MDFDDDINDNIKALNSISYSIGEVSSLLHEIDNKLDVIIEMQNENKSSYEKPLVTIILLLGTIATILYLKL